jgi:hypothetical protein
MRLEKGLIHGYKYRYNFDRRSYFCVSDTSLEIYDEETRVICLRKATESNNFKKNKLHDTIKNRMT